MTELPVKKLTHFDQESCEPVAREFVEFYYKQLNSHSCNEIAYLFTEHSIGCFEGEKYIGNSNIISKLTTWIEQGIQYAPNSIDVCHSGARRLNILITGKVKLNTQAENIYNFSEYIHLGIGNNGQFWIPTIIFRIVKE